MWNTIMAINSFVFWPASFIFCIYAIGRGILLLDWKIAIIGIVVFAVVTGVQIVLGILDS